MFSTETTNSDKAGKAAANLQRLRKGPITVQVQTKLNIGQPNDNYEKEANQVADKVVNMSNTTQGPVVQKMEDEEIQTMPISEIQRQPEEEVQAKPHQLVQREAKEELQMKPENDGETASAEVSTEIERSKGGGSPLSSPVRSQMESGIGSDFGKVRIHTGSQAENLSQQLNAQAFTVGNDVYFNKGKYNPESQSGKHLLAHELTHTVQQSSASSLKQKTVSSGITIPTIQREIIESDGKPVSYRFKIDYDLFMSFLTDAQTYVKDGPLTDVDIKSLIKHAERYDQTVNEITRLFLAGLCDPETAQKFSTRLLKSGFSFSFPLSAIKPHMDKIRNFNRPDEGQLEAERNQSPKVEKAYITRGEKGAIKALKQLAENQIFALCGKSNQDKIADIIAFAKSKPFDQEKMLSAIINSASSNSYDDHTAAAMVYAIAHKEEYQSVSNLINGSLKVDALSESKINAQFGKGTKAIYSTRAGEGDSNLKADTFYINSKADIHNLMHRSTIIHELTHAQDEISFDLLQGERKKVQEENAERKRKGLPPINRYTPAPVDKVKVPQVGLESTAYIQQATYILDQIIEASQVDKPVYIKQVKKRENSIVMKAVVIKVIQEPDRYKQILIELIDDEIKDQDKSETFVSELIKDGEGKAYERLEQEIIKEYESKVESSAEANKGGSTKSEVVNPNSLAIMDGLKGDSMIDWIYKKE